MAVKIPKALYMDNPISSEDALKVLDGKKNKRGLFTCPECRGPLKVMKQGHNGHPSHFEHFPGVGNCPLRYKHYKPKTTEFSVDDEGAIEGYLLDHRANSKVRNSRLSTVCKERDNYTCQACGNKPVIKGKPLVECHHLRPLAEGQRETRLSDLVTLCPTCHRAVHTRQPPFGPLKIKKLLKSEV